MFIKQIDMKTAFELASRGMEIKTMAPIGPGTGWENMEPDTLQNMLSDVLFFRKEPAIEVPMVKDPLPAKRKGSWGKLPSTDLQLCGYRCQMEKDSVGKLLALRKAG